MSQACYEAPSDLLVETRILIHNEAALSVVGQSWLWGIQALN